MVSISVPNRPNRPDRPNMPNRPNKPDRPNMSNRPKRPNRSNRPNGSNGPNRPNRPTRQAMKLPIEEYLGVLLVIYKINALFIKLGSKFNSFGSRLQIEPLSLNFDPCLINQAFIS